MQHGLGSNPQNQQPPGRANVQHRLSLSSTLRKQNVVGNVLNVLRRNLSNLDDTCISDPTLSDHCCMTTFGTARLLKYDLLLPLSNLRISLFLHFHHHGERINCRYVYLHILLDCLPHCGGPTLVLFFYSSARRLTSISGEHYRSDHHRYNMKRRVAGLPPISVTLFNQRVLERKAETAITTTPKSMTCDLCR